MFFDAPFFCQSCNVVTKVCVNRRNSSPYLTCQCRLSTASFRDLEKEFMKRGFTYLGEGASRRGFRRDNIVVKVPRFVSEFGIEDNIVEWRAYQKYRNDPTELGFYFAPCRWMNNGCLMMPYIEKLEFGNLNLKYPSWADKIDCNQVGLYKDKVVCYDYANDIFWDN